MRCGALCVVWHTFGLFLLLPKASAVPMLRLAFPTEPRKHSSYTALVSSAHTLCLDFERILGELANSQLALIGSPQILCDCLFPGVLLVAAGLLRLHVFFLEVLIRPPRRAY